MRHLVGISLCLALVTGCQQAPQTAAPAVGRSAFAFVEAPALTGKKAELALDTEKESLDVLVAARPREPLAQPVYPRAALTSHAGSAVVGVRIEVNADGQVTEVGPSLMCFSTPGPFAGAFRAAVETAVTQWRFVPAKHRRLERVTLADGSVYWRNGGEERAEAAFDVAFTFSAEGEVSAPPVR